LASKPIDQCTATVDKTMDGKAVPVAMRYLPVKTGFGCIKFGR
jgi:hypothetical protein